MKHNQYRLRSFVWLYPGMSGWHFVSVPKDISGDIKERFGDLRRGWGSIRVFVTIGKTRWKTSIFPDKKAACYLLPLKADVRKKEGILAEDMISLLLEIRK